MHTQVPITQNDIDVYTDLGYLVIHNAFSKNRIQSLLAAVNRLIDRALAGDCEIGWIDKGKRLPARVGHLLHPDKYDYAYAKWLDEDLSPHIETLLDDEPVRHSLFGMLANGGGQPYCQSWHRDIGKPGDDDEESFLHRLHGNFLQFNAPLLPEDRFLNIVPASHLRASTCQELEVAKGNGNLNMPNAIELMLEPGDIVYYNANLWHRGWNPNGEKRWTMHCAFWKAKYPVMKHEYGQLEVLLKHIDEMPAVARQYVQNYIDNYPQSDPKSLLEI